MKRITATLAPASSFSEAEVKQFIEWAEASRPLTRMDPEVVGYPRSAILIASDDEVTAYATVQSLLFIDHFIPKPGLEDRRRVLSLGRFSQLIDQVAQDSLHKEAMFVTKDAHYAAVAAKHGWSQQKDMIVLRKKVRY
jgi:hypothetical protein